MNIAIAGVGYVGLTSAACLAQLGNEVVGFDINRETIASLRSGVIRFSEPGLPELVADNVRAGRLTFTADPKEAMHAADMAFVCVGTPSDAAGRVDLTQVESTVATLAASAKRSFTTVLKSTVPVGSTERVAEIMAGCLAAGVRSSIVANPEFLREGSAIQDFFESHRIVIGSWDPAAAETVAGLYTALRCPILLTDPESAQMIKYASNAFLATKISFINEISRIADAVGANVQVVAEGMGLDGRIGPQFLEAGLGYGGSCFPKDVLALSKMAEDRGHPSALLSAVMDINRSRRRIAIEQLRTILGGTLQDREVCVLGLAFKAHTDDVREAPALSIISALCNAGAAVRAYDPIAMSSASRVAPPHARLRYCDDAYAASRGSNVIFIATDWPQFRALDWQRVRRGMNGHALVDGRGLLSAEEMGAVGFDYVGLTG